MLHHRLPTYMVGLIGMAILVSTGTADGASSHEGEDLAALQRANRDLQARVKMLENELTAARARITELEAELETRDDAPKPVKAANIQTGADKDETASVQEDDTGSVTRTRTYQNVAQILRELPPDARPHPRTGWSREAREEAVEWMEENVVGHQYMGHLVVQHVSSPIRHSSGRSVTTITPRTTRANFVNVEVEHVVTAGAPLSVGLVLVGDDSFTQRVRRIQPNHRIRVQGQIKQVRLGSTGRRMRATVVLEQMQVVSPDLRR